MRFCISFYEHPRIAMLNTLTFLILPILTHGLYENIFVRPPSPDPVIQTEYGKLRGKQITSGGKKCDIFLGVPFAQPPIGQLRFQKPQEPSSWQGTRNASEFGSICMQDGINGTFPWESEDCLYLNIFVPKRHSTQKLPVMVFIHGGGFIFGSAAEYGVNGTCENLASRGVIVITIQYRLFLYGFASTGTSDAQGNYGIWDQIAALEWVKKNIAHFGGDPSKVTIFGESAGGASVPLLTYTPVAKDLFHQSIAESGSALAAWCNLTDLSVQTTRELAKSANCTDRNPGEILNCLRRLSTSELQKAYDSVKGNGSIFNDYWSIRIDGELFKNGDLKELNPGKPSIIGVNSLEVPGMEDKISKAVFYFNALLDNAFPGSSVKNKILKDITNYEYIDSKGDRNNATFVCQQLSQLISDQMFHAPAAREAMSKMHAGIPVWVYKFDYYSKNVFPPRYPFVKGAPHAHELCYLFLKPLPPDTPETMYSCPAKYTGRDRKMANYIGEMWTNFAIKGNPSPQQIDWPRFQNITNANTMHIQEKLNILSDFYLDIANFWNSLVPRIESAFNGTVDV